MIIFILAQSFQHVQQDISLSAFNCIYSIKVLGNHKCKDYPIACQISQLFSGLYLHRKVF